MNRVGNRIVWRRLVPPIGDLLIFYAGLAASLMLREPRLLNLYTAMIFLPLFVVWIISVWALGLYDLRLARNLGSLIKNLIASSMACLFSGAMYFYLTTSYTGLKPKTMLVVGIALSHVLIFAFRRAWLWLLKFDLLDQRFVFLGDPSHLREIEAGMPHHKQETGLCVVPWQWPGVDLVVTDGAWVDKNWASSRQILLTAIAHHVPVVTLEDFYESIFGKVSPYYAGRPSWALEFVLPNRVSGYVILKRAIDVVGSLVLLAATAPLLAGAAALVALIDGRPVFYKQSRAGMLGRPFWLWKFRTMSVGADAAGPFNPEQQQQRTVTRLGAILRRFRVDELPQLWNVLRGEMSLVGPRPEWMREVAVLEKMVPSYHLRHLVKPGITGWAQVKYRATNSIHDSIEKIHYDLFYVKYSSLGLDIGILLKTIKRVLVNDTVVEKLPTPPLPATADAQWMHDLASVHN